MNINKFLGIVVSLLVLVVASAGFYISGRPVEQRMSKFDSTRVQHLKSISYGILGYAASNKRLPETIALLVDGIRMSSLPTDPEQKTGYTYKVISENTYSLCASFSRPSTETAQQDFWYHPAGTHCYELAVNLNE